MGSIIFPIIVMGVTGCGKSAIGTALALAFRAHFTDGDHLHPHENIEKMSAGIPLGDDDRWSWLDKVALQAREDGKQIISCSALKRLYRNRLRQHIGKPVQFIFLDISRQTSHERLSNRSGHFMPTSLIDSQFDALERPDHEPDVLKVIPQIGECGIAHTSMAIRMALLGTDT